MSGLRSCTKIILTVVGNYNIYLKRQGCFVFVKNLRVTGTGIEGDELDFVTSFATLLRLFKGSRNRF
jgi:hypothetical protein